MSKLQITTKYLIDIVEGINNANHGTWINSHGLRLKDSKEWVNFYLETTKIPMGDVNDLVEYLEYKNLIDDFQLWANGPSPTGLQICQNKRRTRFKEGVVKKGGVNHQSPSSTRPAPPRGQGGSTDAITMKDLK